MTLSFVYVLKARNQASGFTFGKGLKKFILFFRNNKIMFYQSFGTCISWKGSKCIKVSTQVSQASGMP